MKFIAIGISLFLVSKEVKADQLAWISLSAAKRAIDCLKMQNEIVLWCACCIERPKKIVRIKSLDYKQVSDEFYQVVLRYEDNLGNVFTEGLDLAYVHIQFQREWHCLGQILNMKCDPCTYPFKTLNKRVMEHLFF